jgi:phage terminase small subunit
MAGAKGKSGGPRKNSGGARPGAGRKPVPPVLNASTALLTSDPKAFLTAVMNDVETDMKVRTDAAKALMPFVHQKLGEGGKKEQKDEAAKKVASRFASASPPKLVAAGGKKV